MTAKKTKPTKNEAALSKAIKGIVAANLESTSLLGNMIDPISGAEDDLPNLEAAAISAMEAYTQAVIDVLGEQLQAYVIAHVEDAVSKIEVATEPATAPAKKTRKPRTKKAPVETEPANEEDTGAEEITADDLKERTTKFLTSGDMAANRKVVLGALKGFGASNLTKLAPENYAKFLELVENG